MNDRRKMRNVPSGDSPTSFTGYIAAIAKQQRRDFYPGLVVQIVQLETKDGAGLLIMEVRDRTCVRRNERGVTVSTDPPKDRDGPEKGKTIVDHGNNPADSL